MGLKVLPAGLFLDGEFNFLACSPDGLIKDQDILEIKCPYSAKDLTLQESVAQKKVKFWRSITWTSYS